jgi:hypothetical protein
VEPNSNESKNARSSLLFLVYIQFCCTFSEALLPSKYSEASNVGRLSTGLFYFRLIFYRNNFWIRLRTLATLKVCTQSSYTADLYEIQHKYMVRINATSNLQYSLFGMWSYCKLSSQKTQINTHIKTHNIFLQNLSVN